LRGEIDTLTKGVSYKTGSFVQRIEKNPNAERVSVSTIQKNPEVERGFSNKFQNGADFFKAQAARLNTIP
jgi:hypothetical protein